jgi:hypothetical protein
MLKQIRPSALLAAVLIVSPIFLTTPASAGNKHRTRQVRGRVVTPARVVTPNRRVVTPARVVTPNRRVVRLANGDMRLPHGEIVSARRLVRMRNQSNQVYWRLPNGDVIVPTQEIIPARSIVRLQNGQFRLQNGVLLRI